MSLTKHDKFSFVRFRISTNLSHMLSSSNLFIHLSSGNIQGVVCVCVLVGMDASVFDGIISDAHSAEIHIRV